MEKTPTGNFVEYIIVLPNRDAPMAHNPVLVVFKASEGNIKFVSVVAVHNIVPQ